MSRTGHRTLLRIIVLLLKILRLVQPFLNEEA